MTGKLMTGNSIIGIGPLNAAHTTCTAHAAHTILFMPFVPLRAFMLFMPELARKELGMHIWNRPRMPISPPSHMDCCVWRRAARACMHREGLWPNKTCLHITGKQ